MNTHSDRHPSTDCPAQVDERQWQAQEQARLAEREGPSAVPAPGWDATPAQRHERMVARMLRQPLPDLLGPDFAARVAARAEAAAAARVDDTAGSALERHLLQALLACGAVAVAWVARAQGAAWVAAVRDALHLESGMALNWALASAACIGIAWLSQELVTPARR